MSPVQTQRGARSSLRIQPHYDAPIDVLVKNIQNAMINIGWARRPTSTVAQSWPWCSRIADKKRLKKFHLRCWTPSFRYSLDLGKTSIDLDVTRRIEKIRKFQYRKYRMWIVECNLFQRQGHLKLILCLA